jgi:CRP/FNR family cyclic AMP-dependent transcriptional regulator
MEMVGPRRTVVHLLDLDPDLGRDVPAAQREQARRHAVARERFLYAGHGQPVDLSTMTASGSLGLLMADGLLLRRVTVASRVAGELFGPGDLLRPWDNDVVPYTPLKISVDWLVLTPASVAVLDHEFTQRVARWPSISIAVMQRAAERAGRLALRTAIAQLTRVDTRLLLIFWLLANRWGAVTPDGIRVQLPLTHEILAMLVGNQRPTVTLGLQKLAQQGLLIRHSSDEWLLTNQAIQTLDA